ncbi:MAG: aspartate kinase [Bacteroidetes bacterium]|nr:aspartate kinase [Bacteroidota bacterium]
MKVFKFGGASVQSADGIKNVASIISQHSNQPLLIVVSAMGKITNQLEILTEAFMESNVVAREHSYAAIKDYHYNILNELFEKNHNVFLKIEQIFHHLKLYIEQQPGTNYNFEYDRIVSTGEILSSQILSHYLNKVGLNNQWMDSRNLIITNASYRDAQPDWNQTSQAVKNKILPYLSNSLGDNKHPIVVTQGFIGGTTQGFTTTLGREGSDFSAAIFAFSLDAEEVTIWKDVPGLLNADPKIFKETVLLPKISYQEAIELSYYGATVIHPKTLKPLLSKNIPLRVKSFIHPEKEGSLIHKLPVTAKYPASYIFKFNQVLLSIMPKDFSFIAEDNLSLIFSSFARIGVKINLMQNSAISFSVCFDKDKTKTPALMKDLEKNFNLRHNENLELITIRHYENAVIGNIIKDRKVLLEQKNRTTLQLVVS